MSRIIKTIALGLIVGLLTVPTGVAASTSDNIDINVASAETLTALPRIGPKIAQRVIEYREQAGGFKTVEELMNVRGIGPRVFDEIKEKIMAGPTVAKPSPQRDKTDSSKDGNP